MFLTNHPVLRTTLIFCVFSLIGQSCKRGDPVEITKTDLKKSLYHYLTTSPVYDSTKVRYQIQDVVYFDDDRTKSYICEFKVIMHLKDKDTTGMMKCYIARDFSTLHRVW